MTQPPSSHEPDTRPTRIEPWLYWALGGVVVVIVAVMAISSGGEGTKVLDGAVPDTTGSTSEAASDTQPIEETTTSTLGPGEAVGEVFLEPAGSLGPDAFTGEVFADPVVPTTAPLVTMPPTTSTSSTTATTSASGETTLPPVVISSMYGDSPGLYGGTGDNARCDKEAILAFLERNPEKAAAWVAAQNADPTFQWDDRRTSLTVSDLRDYFDELTPVTLLYDTRVTNYGFRDNRPTPRQSVLQAGTAVLVDMWGVPRARCACGNPLTPPRPSTRPPTWVGPQWPGFDPTIIIVIDQSITIIEHITIINVFTGDIIIRPVGTDGTQDTTQPPATGATTPLTIPPDIAVGTGDVQVTLIWATDSDMDLHVIDPMEFEIYYMTDVSPSGGELDVDDIPDSGDSGPHVENVFWPTNAAPPGQYVAFVRHYNSLSGASSGYTMEVRVGGVVIHTETGVLAEDEDSVRFVFLVDSAAGIAGSAEQAVSEFLAANGLPLDSQGVCGPDGEPETYCYEYVRATAAGDSVYSAVLQFGQAPTIWMLLSDDGGMWAVIDTAQGGAGDPW